MRSIKSLKNLKNKIVLLRVDFNVPLKKQGGKLKITDDLRITRTMPTIKYLLRAGAKIILVTHFSQNINSVILMPRLKKYFKNLIFAKNPFIFNFRASKSNIFLIENIRKWQGEEKNDAKFAKKLANIADLYINDAFGACHRKHASISAITHYIPSYSGFLLEQEIKNLTKAMLGKKPMIIVIGGVKISTKLPLIKSFFKKSHSILVGGAIANNIFAANHIITGKSQIDKKFFDKDLIKNRKIILPDDIVTAKNKNAKVGVIKSFTSVQKNEYILDIGPKTIKKFNNIIKKGKTIIFNGPMGIIENKAFAKGTIKIIQAIIKNKKAFSVIGGGDTLSIIPINYKLQTTRLPSASPEANGGQANSNIFISTGGGAMLDFLAGEKLPGIEALK